MNPPQINNGASGYSLIVTDILPLPNDTPWGNLTLKSLKIVQRIGYLNQKLRYAYQHFAELKEGKAAAIDLCSLEVEEIIYWIRKTVDEFVQILFVASHFSKEGKYPKKIEIDSIGKLLNEHSSELYSLFVGHYAKLEQLNEVANAYKHSFLNSDLNFIGRDEPVVFALTVARNSLEKPPYFTAISLADFVKHFDELNQFFRQKAVELFEKPDSDPATKL